MIDFARPAFVRLQGGSPEFDANLAAKRGVTPLLRFGGDTIDIATQSRSFSTRVQLAGETVSVAWREYGNPASNNVIVCVHGLTRNSRDFDRLARHLAKTQDCRVICPDIVGRGQSAWFRTIKKR